MSLEYSPARETTARSTPKRREFPLSDRFLSRREAAEYLGLSPSQLAHDVVHGRLGIPYHRFGQRARYRISELDTWAERHRAGGRAA